MRSGAMKKLIGRSIPWFWKVTDVTVGAVLRNNSNVNEIICSATRKGC